MVKKVNVVQTIHTSDLVKKPTTIKKIEDIEKKIPNHDKYITTNEFHKLTREHFAERLKQQNYQLKLILLIS